MPVPTFPPASSTSRHAGVRRTALLLRVRRRTYRRGGAFIHSFTVPRPGSGVLDLGDDVRLPPQANLHGTAPAARPPDARAHRPVAQVHIVDPPGAGRRRSCIHLATGRGSSSHCEQDWIGAEPASAARTLVHDDAQAPLERPTPARLAPQPCSGVRTAHRPRQVSKTEEISPGIMQHDTETTRSSQGFSEIPGLPRL